MFCLMQEHFAAHRRRLSSDEQPGGNPSGNGCCQTSEQSWGEKIEDKHRLAVPNFVHNAVDAKVEEKRLED